MNVNEEATAEIASASDYMRRLSPSDAGWYIDSHHGQYAVPMMLRLARDYGYNASEAAAIAQVRWLQGCWDVSAEEAELVTEECDRAEAWLNEHIAPEGFSFGWFDGDYMLWSQEDWEQD